MPGPDLARTTARSSTESGFPRVHRGGEIETPTSSTWREDQLFTPSTTDPANKLLITLIYIGEQPCAISAYGPC